MYGKMRHTACAALLTAGLLAAAPAAHADVITSGDGSILGGNQIAPEVNIPINICGNAITVLGITESSCEDSGAAVVDQQPPTKPNDKCESGHGDRRGCDGKKPERPRDSEQPKDKPPVQEGTAKPTPAPAGSSDKEIREAPAVESDDSSTAQEPKERTSPKEAVNASPLLPVTGPETTALAGGGIVAIVLGVIALCIGYGRRGHRGGTRL